MLGLGAGGALLSSNTLTVSSKSLFFSASSLSPSIGSCPRASLSKDLPPASRIFVRNLSYSMSETSLNKAFSKFGQIVEVKLVRDDDRKRSKGYAFVQYSCQDDAVLAIEHMDQKIINGRVVYVELAKPVNNKFSAYPRSSGPPKQQKSEKLKQ